MLQSHPSTLSFLGLFSLNGDFAWDFGVVFLSLLSLFLAPTGTTVFSGEPHSTWLLTQPPIPWYGNTVMTSLTAAGRLAMK